MHVEPEKIEPLDTYLISHSYHRHDFTHVHILSMFPLIVTLMTLHLKHTVLCSTVGTSTVGRF